MSEGGGVIARSAIAIVKGSDLAIVKRVNGV